MKSHTLTLLLPLTLLAWSPMATAAEYYVDPVTGNMSNPGTAVSPWSTMAAVAAAKTFTAGDHIYLRRGDHGTVTVTGINTDDVFIEPEPGHTPVVRLSMINAHHWYIKGLTILGGVVIDNQTNENSDFNTFENCYMPTGGFQVYGYNITLLGNHIRTSGILFGFHSNNGVVKGNTIEDFYSDGIHNKGNYGLWENNVVMNSHKINGNHNDLFQSLSSSGNVLRGNEFRAYSDPNQADLIAPGVSDAQGIGLFDGWYDNWVIENNVVLVDHPIGIWIQGARDCVIKNNTVARCGQYSLFPYLYSPERLPNIRIAAKKSGAVSTNNVVINNASERFELDAVIDNSGTSIGTAMNNIVVAKSAFTNTYLNWAKKDLHVKAGASIINAGTSTNNPPATDADGNDRPFNSVWDCGAYEFGYAPSSADNTPPTKPQGLTAMIVTGYGVDLHWTASTDNRKVTGYDIFRNGVLVGRTRAGTNYLDITTTTTGSYSVQAFDHSDNKSLYSDAVGGTPPVPDLQSPTVPAGVAATPQSTTSILITWSASTDNVGVTGYDVWRDGGKIGSSSTTSYTDTGLTASTLYSYTIFAKDFAGNSSDVSNAAEATTLAPDLTPPSVPANVNATAMSSGSIQVAWTAATDNRGVTGYQIYRDGTLIDTVAETSYADTGLVALTSYSYTVKALDADGNASAASTPPAATTTLEPAPVMVGESFEYTAAANLNGLNGGAGWAGPWAVGYNALFPATVEAGNPGSISGLTRSGNHLKFWTAGNGSTYENLDRSFESLIDDGGQTVWMALVVGLCNSKNQAFWQLSGLTTDAAGTTVANLFESVANGTPTPFKFGGTTLFAGDINYTPHLILVKIVMSGDANAETLTAYHNPNLAADPSTWTGVSRSLYANGGLIGFSYRGGRASTATPNLDFHMDEFRLAPTWQAAVGQTGSPPADAEAPSVPANVTATAQSATSILVTWDASTDNVGVAGYEVYRDGVSVGSPVANNFTDIGLTAATEYSYTVVAKDAIPNTSGPSNPVSATTQAPPADTTAPTIPANVAAAAQSATSILVTWNASTDNVGVTGYEVYRDGSLVSSPVANTYTDTGRTPSTLYAYAVKAKDAAGNLSAASPRASATTQAAVLPAAVLVEETFDSYATGGNIGGLNGGTGWTAAWVSTRAAAYTTIVAGNVNGLGTGNKMSFGYSSTTPQNSRTFTAIDDALDATYWLGFELQVPQMKSSQTLSLNGTTGTMITMTAATSGAAPTYEFFGTTVVTPASAAVQLFVVKIEMSAVDNETLTCYVNPNLLTNPAAWSVAATSSQEIAAITGITLRGTQNTGDYRTYLDNIRLATTWQGAVGQVGDTEAPTAPASLTATAQSGTSIALTWSASTDNVGVSAYDVYRNGLWVYSPTATSYTDIGLAASTLYSYTVKARDAVPNTSLASLAASATTFAPVQTWRQEKFGVADEAGTAADDQDPNHNGIKNLLEYALGGEPLQGTTGRGILPQAGRDAANKLQIHFARYPDRSDLTLTVEAADSPAGPWSDLAVSTAGAAFTPAGAAVATETGTGAARSVTVTDLYQTSDPSHPRRFIRLKAER